MLETPAEWAHLIRQPFGEVKKRNNVSQKEKEEDIHVTYKVVIRMGTSAH